MIRRKQKKQSVDELTVGYEAWLVNSLKKKKRAAQYLQVALDSYQEDGCADVLLLAFRRVTEAQGGIAKLAECAQLNRESLYKTLSAHGNPKLQTLGVLLKALGFRLSIKPA